MLSFLVVEGLDYICQKVIVDLVLFKIRPKEIVVFWLVWIFNLRLPEEGFHFL